MPSLQLSDRKLHRLAALCGLGFAALAVASRLVAPVPVLPEIGPGGLVRSYYLAHEGALVARGMLWGVGSVLAVAFLAVLVSQLQERWLSLAALVGGVGALTLSTLALAALLAVLEFRRAEVLGATGGDSGGAVALFELYSALDRLAGYPTVVLLVATSVATLLGGAAALSGRLLPRWFGWSGLVAAVLVLAAAVGLERLGGLAFVVVLAWVAAASLLLAGAGGRRASEDGNGRPAA